MANTLRFDILGTDQTGPAFDSASRRVSALNSELKALAAGFISVGVATQALQKADAWQRLEKSIMLSTEATKDFAKTFEGLYEISQRTGTRMEDTISSFTGLNRAAQAIGATKDQTLALSEAVSSLVSAGGASRQAQAGALMQFGQAMNSTKIQAEEFSSMLDGAAMLVDVIAKGMGKTSGELQTAVKAGEVLSRDVFQALLKQTDDINSKFSSMSKDMGQSWNMVDNALSRVISDADKLLGVTERIAKSFQGFAEFLDDDALGKIFTIGVVKAKQFAAGSMDAIATFREGLAAISFGEAEERFSTSARLLREDAVELRKEAESLDEVLLEVFQEKPHRGGTSTTLPPKQSNAAELEEATKKLVKVQDSLLEKYAKERKEVANWYEDAKKAITGTGEEHKKYFATIDKLRDAQIAKIDKAEGEGRAKKAIEVNEKILDSEIKLGEANWAILEKQERQLKDIEKLWEDIEEQRWDTLDPLERDIAKVGQWQAKTIEAGKKVFADVYGEGSEEFAKFSKAVYSTAEESAKKLLGKHSDATKALIEIAKDGWSAFKDSMADALLDGEMRLDKFASSFARNMAKITMNRLMFQPLETALFGGYGTGGGPGLLGGFLSSAAGSVSGWFGGGESPTADLAGDMGNSILSGARADGGPVWPGGKFLVGERGPEIFAPTQHGQIIAAGAGQGNMTFNFNMAPGTTISRDSARQMAATFQAALDRHSKGLR